MREYSFSINNEQGFYLPFVIFISMIFFSVITTVMIIYNNELYVSKQLQEQMKSETIAQMAFTKFKGEKLFEYTSSGNVNYNFPQGNVEIVYELTETNIVNMKLTIETDAQYIFYTQQKLFIE